MCTCVCAFECIFVCVFVCVCVSSSMSVRAAYFQPAWMCLCVCALNFLQVDLSGESTCESKCGSEVEWWEWEWESVSVCESERGRVFIRQIINIKYSQRIFFDNILSECSLPANIPQDSSFSASISLASWWLRVRSDTRSERDFDSRTNSLFVCTCRRCKYGVSTVLMSNKS